MGRSLASEEGELIYSRSLVAVLFACGDVETETLGGDGRGDQTDNLVVLILRDSIDVFPFRADFIVILQFEVTEKIIPLFLAPRTEYSPARNGYRVVVFVFEPGVRSLTLFVIAPFGIGVAVGCEFADLGLLVGCAGIGDFVRHQTGVAVDIDGNITANRIFKLHRAIFGECSFLNETLVSVARRDPVFDTTCSIPFERFGE